MQHCKLGTTDIQVSAIALGCMSLTPEREAESHTVVQRANELGINF